MNSTTVVSIVGIAGTLLGSVSTGLVNAWTTRSSGRRQDQAEARQARRQAYATLATALVICQGTVGERMENLINRAGLGPDLDNQFRKEKDPRLAGAIESQLQAVTDALGAVLIEGPGIVAGIGQEAVEHLRGWAERLDDWLDSDDPDTTIVDQARFGREDQADTALMVDRFSKACRDVIHPEDSSRQLYGRRRRALPWR